jgi:L-threonylcarbamoyladenylate synthase
MDFQEDIEQCLAVLARGGLIVYPTDTIWGIGCDATNSDAVARIYALKRRQESKSMIVLVADEKDVIRYTAAPDLQLFDYLKTVTKPTTVIYPGAIGLAPDLLAADGSVGIRIVGEDFCRHLIRRFKKPLVSTSANISGEPAPGNYAEVSNDITDGVDYVVKYRREDKEKAQPSSVIRWGRDGKAQVIRA